MGLVESDIEIMLKERNIKAFAIVADNNFVSLDVLDKIIQVLSLHIGLDRFAVIKRDCGYFVEVPIQTGGFDIQIDRGISEFWE